eukprot:g79601.t1
MSSGGAAKPSQPQVSIAQLGVHVAEQSQPQVSIPQLGVSVAEQSQPQSSIAQLGVSVAKQSQPQVSIPQLGFDRFTINRHGTNNVQARSEPMDEPCATDACVVLVGDPLHLPAKSTFEIILPPKEEKSLLESPVTQEGFNSINTMLATVDVANAKAWKAEDQKKILKAVAKTGEGIHGLNKVVVEQLRDWLAKTAKAAIPEEPSSKDALSLIRGVAILMSNQGTLAPSGSSASETSDKHKRGKHFVGTNDQEWMQVLISLRTAAVNLL